MSNIITDDPYPTIVKFSENKHKIEFLVEFLQWMEKEKEVELYKEITCPNCSGVDSNKCMTCSGNGVIPEFYTPEDLVLQYLEINVEQLHREKEQKKKDIKELIENKSL